VGGRRNRPAEPLVPHLTSAKLAGRHFEARTSIRNPGSVGPRRFRLPITIGRMTVEHGKLHAEIVELSVEN
jgi:hypothetical protein